MKLIKKAFEKDGNGYATIIPEESEDLWHIYNLAMKGDMLKANTYRKTQKESSVGSVSTEVRKLMLSLQLTGIEYDAAGDLLRFSGRNRTESPYIKLGQYHTIEVTLNNQLTLYKKNWDTLFRARLDEALDPHKSGEVLVVLMDSGIANFYLLSTYLAKDIFKINVNIPKRRGTQSGHEKAMERFFGQVLQGLQQHANFEVVKCVLLAGPGFVKDEFFNWMLKEASNLGLTNVLINKSKFVTCRASSAFKHSLNEILNDPTVKARVDSTKASAQVNALEALYSTLQKDPDRACYGPRQVKYAVEQGAVQSLFVTEKLFRSANIRVRKQYIAMTEDVKAAGNEVVIFSDMHVSGEQLSSLSGIAAILRFPLPELEDLDDDAGAQAEEGEEEEEEKEGEDEENPALDFADPFSDI